MIDKDRNVNILSVYVNYFVETYLEIERKKNGNRLSVHV